MKIFTLHKPAFSVIGKMGGTNMGPTMKKTLWSDTNFHFEEISSLGVRDANSRFAGFYGLMSDPEGKMKPWTDNFTKGLYLTGIEVKKGSEIPNKSWRKWDIKEHLYLAVEVDDKNYKATFDSMVYFQINFEGFLLAASPFDFTDPRTMKNYIYFPVIENPLKIKEADQTEKISSCGLHCGYCFFTQCSGCASGDSSCSFGYSFPNHKCPNVVCSSSKKLRGCYECQELETCTKWFFGNIDQIAHASSIFIKKHGKAALESAIKNMISDGLNYNKSLLALPSDELKVAKLEEFAKK